MNKFLSLFIFLIVFKLSFSQQDKQFTHYMFDRMSFNPAITGFKGYSATLIYRNQWDRVERAPNTSLLNLEGNLSEKKLGFGLSLSNDAIGFQRNNTAILNIAPHIPTNWGTLSAGVGVGLINSSFSPNWVPPQTMEDPSLPEALAETGFDLNVGLHWRGRNLPYYIGISATHIAPPTLQKIHYSVARHYYILAGYDIKLNMSRKVYLKPNILIKSDGTTGIFDINMLADFWLNTTSYLWGGLSYRGSDAVSLMAGYALLTSNNGRNNIVKIGYSFDIMTNPLNSYGKGTHELILNFSLFPPAPVNARHGNPHILN